MLSKCNCEVCLTRRRLCSSKWLQHITTYGSSLNSVVYVLSKSIWTCDALTLKNHAGQIKLYKLYDIKCCQCWTLYISHLQHFIAIIWITALCFIWYYITTKHHLQINNISLHFLHLCEVGDARESVDLCCVPFVEQDLDVMAWHWVSDATGI